MQRQEDASLLDFGEARLGASQDIEWYLADSTFYVVQARLITTLPPAPVQWMSPVPGAPST